MVLVALVCANVLCCIAAIGTIIAAHRVAATLRRGMSLLPTDIDAPLDVGGLPPPPPHG
jgi:hypothetical protein